MLPAAQPPAISAATVGSKKLPQLTIGDIWGEGLVQLSGNSVVGPFVKEIVNSYTQSVLGPLGPQLLGGLTKVLGEALTNYFVLRTANNMEGPQALQTLKNLQADIQDDPDTLQRLERMAQPYQSGNDTSASQTLDLVSDKLVAGIDPAVAIEETPVPESEIFFATDQMSGETEPLSTGEIEVKSLPPYYEDTTITTRDGNIELVESLAEPVLVPETTGSFIPGIGPSPLSERIPLLPSPEATTVDQPNAITTPEPTTTPDTGDGSIDIVEPDLLSEQPLIQEPNGLFGSPFIPGFGPSSQPPLFQEQITSLPPEDTVDTAPPLTTSTSNACQIISGLCQQQEPPPQLPPVDICQEQPDLPQCPQEDTDSGGDLEYSDVSDGNTVFNYFDEGIGSYQEEEDDNNEDNNEEEEDYEEVGGYQEEEEQYSEADSEEDFSEEEDESGEYYEE